VSVELPAELVAALPRTDGGLPVLFGPLAAASNPALSLQFAYDDKLDDPLARWGDCLSRVTACYDANPGAPVARCIDVIEPCADDTGGKACCPPACIAGFKALRRQGVEERAAIDQSFLKGACVKGLREQLQAAGVQR
jgi:hypothetical protein